MNFTSYSDLAVQMAVDLVNTRDPLTEGDNLTTVADLHSFLAGYERDWPGQDWHPGRPTRQDLRDVLELRTALRAVFATENADDLIKSLTTQYNRARQGRITAELMDVIGGVEALS